MLCISAFWGYVLFVILYAVIYHQMFGAVLSAVTAFLHLNNWSNCLFLANVNSRSRREGGDTASVCRLSVCNARAPYSVGGNFRQFFYAIWYLDIHGHPRKILRRSSQGNPSVGGVKRKRGSQIQRFWTYRRLSRKRCKMGGKLVLITYRKSYMSFRLAPKSVTLNDLERRNGRCLALFHRNR